MDLKKPARRHFFRAAEDGGAAVSGPVRVDVLLEQWED